MSKNLDIENISLSEFAEAVRKADCKLLDNLLESFNKLDSLHKEQLSTVREMEKAVKRRLERLALLRKELITVKNSRNRT